jgi:biopolymer transport protein ExbD
LPECSPACACRRACSSPIAIGWPFQLSWLAASRRSSIGELQARLQAQAGEHAGNLPELRIATDPAAEYEGMARILAAAEATGMERIAFVR